ncbi:MAG: alpha/beta fold hydrolase [Promethearchaeota archaeon]|jgi:pimeloyl-ACP methyl ester carboxylesterase
MSEIIIKTFQSDVGELAYQKLIGYNKDVVIIYIHGLAPMTSWFMEEFTRQYKKYSLSEYSWIIPHLIGFGESEKPDKLEVYSMENQGRYLYELLLFEKVGEVIIIAHSMGGPVAISLIDKIQNHSTGEIQVKGLFYLEGNLDKNDTFLSSKIAQYPFEEFKQNFSNKVKDLINNFKLDYSNNGPYSIWGSANDLVKLPEEQLLPRLQKLIDFPVYFVFGEKNKGRFTSEELVKNQKLPIIYIPNTGHGMFLENPQEFWKVIKKLLSSCI